MNNEKNLDLGYLSPLSFKRLKDTKNERVKPELKASFRRASNSPANSIKNTRKKNAPSSHNYFEHINISVSRSYIKPEKIGSGLKERPESNKHNTRSQSNLSSNVRKLDKIKSEGALRKVKSFKFDCEPLWADNGVKVDRKQLARIKNKLKTKLEIIDQQLNEVKNAELNSKKIRLTSIKERKLFKKLEELKIKDKNKINKRETTDKRKQTKIVPQRIFTSSKVELVDNLRDNLKAKEHKTSFKAKITQMCKQKIENKEKEKLESKSLKTVAKIREQKIITKSDPNPPNIHKIKTLTSIADLDKIKLEPKCTDTVTKKAQTLTKFNRNSDVETDAKTDEKRKAFVKRQKIVNQSVKDLEQIKLTPILIQSTSQRNTENPLSSRREDTDSLRQTVDTKPNLHEPVDVGLLLENRKLLTIRRFHNKLKHVKSSSELKKLNEWYDSEMGFINKIEASVIPNNEPEFINAKADCTQTINNHSWLNSKKSNIGIDLSFAEEASFKRKGSTLVSDPDVINLKREYVVPIAKSLIANKEIDLSKSNISESGQKPVAMNLPIINTKAYLVEVNKICDSIFDKMIHKYCKLSIKKRYTVPDIFGKKIAGLKSMRAPVIIKRKPSIKLSINPNDVENEISSYFEIIIDNHRDDVLNRLNISYGPDHISLLYKIRIDKQLDLSLYHEYTTKPIIAKDLWRKICANSKKSSSLYKEAYDNLIIDCVNEALCTWRPNVYHFAQFPWQIRPGSVFKNHIDDRDIEGVLTITKNKIKEWSMLLCGYYTTKKTELSDIPTNDSETFTDSIREDRLIKLMNWEVFDAEEKWICYELEDLEFKLRVENSVWEYLLDDLVIDLKVLAI